jgi:uncharacterized phiE125 gp8 family phage protein
MTTKRILAPAVMAVTLEAARIAARADGTSLDAEITTHVLAITRDAEHATGRAFVHQTWQVTLDAFPQAVKLDNAPLASVSHVKFYDANGVQQTLDPQDYLIDAASEPGWIVPAPGKAWPATQERVNAVEVQYVCGYGPDEASVPEEAQAYILGMLEQRYFPSSSAEYLCRLLDGLKVY